MKDNYIRLASFNLDMGKKKVSKLLAPLLPLKYKIFPFRFGMSCGFALVYAPVLIKSIVVYRIFTNTTATKLRFISQPYQLMFTGALLFLQVN